MKTDFVAFLQETKQRLKQTSPAYFRTLSRINSALLFIAGIPTIMDMMDIKDLNVFLPGAGVKIVLKIIAFAALYGKFQNKLTVQSSHKVELSEDGSIVQKPCGDLPFTEKKETQKLLAP